MKPIYIFLLTIFSIINLSAQLEAPFKFNCDDFNLNITSNTSSNIEFISEERYFWEIKDSISKKQKPLLIENKELNKEFQKNYPNKITEHCIHSKSFGSGETENISFCNDHHKIFLIGKEYNFYIFKVNAFEIGCYLLFNTEDETIYSTNAYPIILDNGKKVFDVGYMSGLGQITFFKFKNDKTEYLEILIPGKYRIKDYKIITSPTIFIVTDLIKYDQKEVLGESGFGKKIINDKNKYCRKFLIIR